MNLNSTTEFEVQRQFRQVAIAAVTLSIFSISMAILTVPLLYSYAHHLHSKVLDETNFCKASSRDMWYQMSALQNRLQIFQIRKREKRGWLFGQWRDDGIGDAGVNGAYGAPAPANSNKKS
ncbi:unnamed protein product [Onchocerca ochengi]|uniref:Col_cuticle_N domain-containing protein n=1 Tax=Onchocerca ochengi TaxID=42157 RepID=A0A182EVY9_ONCOC|nr:unnamed protein product [Onchocerca ochengi]